MFCTGAAPTVPGISARFSRPGAPCCSVHADHVVPGLAGTGFDDEASVVFDTTRRPMISTRTTTQSGSRDRIRLLPRAEDQLLRAAEFGMVDHAAHVGVAGHAHQRVCNRWQAERVVCTQGHPAFDRHWLMPGDMAEFSPIRSLI